MLPWLLRLFGRVQDRVQHDRSRWNARTQNAARRRGTGGLGRNLLQLGLDARIRKEIFRFQEDDSRCRSRLS
jgi:hypothetical protein